MCRHNIKSFYRNFLYFLVLVEQLKRICAVLNSEGFKVSLTVFDHIPLAKLFEFVFQTTRIGGQVIHLKIKTPCCIRICPNNNVPPLT